MALLAERAIQGLGEHSYSVNTFRKRVVEISRYRKALSHGPAFLARAGDLS